MKSAALSIALLALWSSPLRAEATAYQALEYLGKHRGADALERVFIVRGKNGDPQPEKWVVFRGRPNAPVFQTTDIRSNGRILSGKASASEAGLPPHAQPVNFSVLNLDTNAAWDIARRHARKEKFRFQRADYELTTDPLAGVPAWTLHLFDEEHGVMGILVLSGATGEVLRPLKRYRYHIEEVNGRAQLVTENEPWGTRAMRSIGRWFSRTGDAYGHDLLRAAGTAEEILVDQRTRDLSEDVR